MKRMVVGHTLDFAERKPRRGRWVCLINGAILGAIPAFAGGFIVNFVLTQRFGL